MSYRTTFPIPFIVFLGMVVISLAITFVLLRWARTEVRKTHTIFLFRQIATAVNTNSDIRQPSDLQRFLRAKNINWNSCSMDDHSIYDGWGSAIEVSFPDRSQLILTSAGIDQRLGTEDDITKSIRINNFGQPGP